MFKIEKNVPYVEKRKNKWPFSEMQIGDSFRVEPEGRDHIKVTSASSYYGKRNGKKFSVRVDKDGVGYRCWRIA